MAIDRPATRLENLENLKKSLNLRVVREKSGEKKLKSGKMCHCRWSVTVSIVLDTKYVHHITSGEEDYLAAFRQHSANRQITDIMTLPAGDNASNVFSYCVIYCCFVYLYLNLCFYFFLFSPAILHNKTMYVHRVREKTARLNKML